MRQRCQVAVIGSGAGGGVIAAELGERGHEVVLLETGGHSTARDFSRFELGALRKLWWPIRFADTGPRSPPIVMVAGRCVGGGTTINTKIALRARDEDFAKWHEASGLVNDAGQPFGAEELAPHYERVESRLGVRDRDDWPNAVRVVERGFKALGTVLEPSRSYTDSTCSRCGTCLQGCPTSAGKSTLVSYIEPAVSRGKLELRPGATVTRVRFTRGARPRATGVEYVDASGERRTLEADVVVVAAGALNTPLLLQRSGLVEVAGGSRSSKLVGQHLGTHTARIVHGLFDEPQDCHQVYPLSARCEAFINDAEGGFVVEASTLMDPIGLASNLVDEQGVPLWGERLAQVMRAYRHWNGLFMMTNDSNNGTVASDDHGGETFTKPISEQDQARLDQAHAFCTRVLKAAGAREVISTGYITSHMQGSCRMGSDPERSAVGPYGESHDVEALFVGDGSLIPSTLSVNPSLTIMALATRVADHIHRDDAGYLGGRSR